MSRVMSGDQVVVGHKENSGGHTGFAARFSEKPFIFKDVQQISIDFKGSVSAKLIEEHSHTR